jgi:hypothetical protein
MAAKIDGYDMKSTRGKSLTEVGPIVCGSALSVNEDNSVVAASVRCGSNLDAICRSQVNGIGECRYGQG